MDPQIFARYAATNVPRYTSYPTAPAFSSAIGEASYHDWLSALAPDTSTSLYVHVPFCRSMCLYCGCHTTITARQDPIDRYLDTLIREITLISKIAPADLRVEHLHFGGGSPALVSPDRMQALMNSLQDAFAFTPDAEIAIEIDPRTLAPEMTQMLGTAGFNRASIGVQCFDPVVQKAINRIQSYEQTADAVTSLRQAGVGGINFDLIYGLPHQTIASCTDTVNKALKLQPDRFSVFGYAHVPDFKQHQRRIDASALPGMEDRLDQSRAIADALRGAGYIEIGLDHFARPDDPLAIAYQSGKLRRNFQGYTTDRADALIGFGSSSISHLPQGYAQNSVLISDYQKRVAEGHLPVTRGYALSAEDRVRAAVIERIMCDRRVDLAAVCGSMDWHPRDIIDRARVDGLVRDGLIEEDGDELELTPDAFPLVRSVAAAFDAYLGQTGPRHSRSV